MATHTSTTHNDIEFYEDRLKNVDLIWCNQIITLIKNNFKQKLKLNDIGCMYGQLYKEISNRNLSDIYDYKGYDLDPEYIKLGIKYYPELIDKLSILDIKKKSPRKANITVCSATFEHLDSPEHALKNLFMCTKDLLILRTMVGSKNISFEQNDKKNADNPYNINQFNLYDIASKFLDNGFNFELITDIATNNSKKYEVGQGSGVIRQMFILIGKKK